MTDITLDEKALAETQAEFDQVPLGLVEAIIAAWFRRASPSQVAPQPQAGEADVAHGYATRLLTSLMEKHYPDRSPEWAPLPDLYGVLTQIDNLSTGLVRASPQAANPAQVTDAVRKAGDKAIDELIDTFGSSLGAMSNHDLADYLRRIPEAIERAIAAIGAGGRPVAWRWRTDEGQEPDEWRYGPKEPGEGAIGRRMKGWQCEPLYALSAPSGHAAVVKPLEWRDGEVRTAFGSSYSVHRRSDGMYEAVGCGSFVDGPHPDIEAAKAAAQADYERRILSALSQPHPADERVVEALETYYARQIEWSKQTFGPALRTGGVIDHIRKELKEIEADPHDLSEWVDVIILAMDGFWRHGGTVADLMRRLIAKQQKNMARTWPDWRTMSEDQAIEHDRSGEAALSTTEGR